MRLLLGKQLQQQQQLAGTCRQQQQFVLGGDWARVVSVLDGSNEGHSEGVRLW